MGLNFMVSKSSNDDTYYSYSKSKIFCLGDVHGGYKALLQCLERSNFNKEEDTLISLGDICDGRDQVYECVEELLTIKNLVAIRGNHDQWFYEFIRTGIHGSQWTQGAHKTMESYINNDSHKSENDKYTKTFKIPESHERFFGTQLNYYIDEKNRLFVHGGFNRHYDINKQSFEYIYYWDRDLWNSALSHEAVLRGFQKTGNLKQPEFKIKDKFLEIYIGHTTTQFWNTTEYMKAANIYNVDCGAGGNGRLCMLNVDTKEAFYSDPLDQIYPEQKGRW